MMKGLSTIFRTGRKQDGNASSRSTSTGSCQQETETDDSFSQLPRFEYPSPLTVRNTFIDEESELQRFYREKQFQSAPARTAIQGQDEEKDWSHDLPDATQTIAEVPSDIWNLSGNLPGAWMPIMPPQPQQQEPLLDSMLLTSGAQSVTESASVTSQNKPPAVLRLADALQSVLEPGSTGFPTMGSVGHYQGLCKPCAFFHTKVCSNGAQCQFCHLCDADERKKRVQMKRQALREEKQRCRLRSIQTQQ